MRCSGGHALQVIQGLRRLGPGVADKRIAHFVMSQLVCVFTGLCYTYECVCVCIHQSEGFAAVYMNASASPASFSCITCTKHPAAEVKFTFNVAQ